MKYCVRIWTQSVTSTLSIHPTTFIKEIFKHKT